MVGNGPSVRPNVKSVMRGLFKQSLGVLLCVIDTRMWETRAKVVIEQTTNTGAESEESSQCSF